MLNKTLGSHSICFFVYLLLFCMFSRVLNFLTFNHLARVMFSWRIADDKCYTNYNIFTSQPRDEKKISLFITEFFIEIGDRVVSRNRAGFITVLFVIIFCIISLSFQLNYRSVQIFNLTISEHLLSRRKTQKS